MNGVHDMGGMAGLGALEIDPDEPLFHAPWEARVLAMTLAMGAWGRWNIDASRHARERIPGAAYLAMTYYEKWLAGLITLIVERDLATAEEVEGAGIALSSPSGGGGPRRGGGGRNAPVSGLQPPSRPSGVRPPVGGERTAPPLSAADVPAVLARGGPASRDVSAPTRFAVGDRVRARNLNPAGHTRLPRYARGHVGVVERDHGVHVLPDANAHFLGERPERLYGVRFSGAELWGDGARGSVHIDLWDSYLERA
jgi:nitrile hydratase